MEIFGDKRLYHRARMHEAEGGHKFKKGIFLPELLVNLTILIINAILMYTSYFDLLSDRWEKSSIEKRPTKMEK